jgi:hypothetical protein
MTLADSSNKEMRWRDYVLTRGSTFNDFWADHGNEHGRRVLFIVGRGFDPRATLGLTRLTEVANNCAIDVLGLDFTEESANNAGKHRAAADANWNAVSSILGPRGSLKSQEVRFRSADGRRIAARSAANIFCDASALDGYTDVVADISAMPRVVYFPLLSRLIFFHDQRYHARQVTPNIHVVVSEDPSLDTVIQELGIDETASFLHPFEGPFNREAKGGYPAVWIPVLGEDRATQIDRIYDLVKPHEVCPVLPSPARNPRRSDAIVMEYQSLLFDQLLVEPRDIIYASESNPFDVYRQVRKAALHYHAVLGLIGGCRVALSALCSKVMSLGILLVAYELKSGPVQLGIAHIECESYKLPTEIQIEVEYVGIWIAGECYRKE